MAIDQPTVSVIIPCYNREEFIADTIESVLAQTYTAWDLTVIDDGCTDGSRSIIEKYADRVSILEHPGRANRGQSAGINLGLASTNGKYVAILDSDDLWFPEKLAEQVDYLESHPSAGMVYGNGEAIDAHGRRLYTIYDTLPPNCADPASLLQDCFIPCPAATLVRRSVFKNTGGFDESLRAAQDHDMLLRVAEISEIHFVNRKWYMYRRHDQAISVNGLERRWKNGFIILEKAVQRYPYPFRAVRKRKAVLHFRLGQCHILAGRFMFGAWNFLHAACYDPARSFQVLVGLEKR